MKNVTVTKMADLSREEWLGLRRTGIGASSAAGVLGCSKWSSPFDVYAEVALGHQIDETPEMKRGKLMEPVVVAMFEEREGLTTTPSLFIKSTKWDFMLGSPDRMVVSGPGKHIAIAGLEAKTAHWSTADQFGDEYTDEIPEFYLVQCHHYLCLTGLSKWYCAVLFGMDDFKVFVVEKDKDMEAYLIETLEKFWVEHIVPRIEPNIFESKAIMEHLAKRYPKNIHPLREMNDEEQPDVWYLEKAIRQHDLLGLVVENCKAHVKNIIGDADGLDLGGGAKITWKRSKDRVKTKWKDLAKELGATPEQIATHSTTAPGPRVFLMPKAWRKPADNEKKVEVLEQKKLTSEGDKI